MRKLFGTVFWGAVLCLAPTFLILPLTAAQAQGGGWQRARGAVPGQRAGAPLAQARQEKRGTAKVQVLTYRFAEPVIVTDADGISDITVTGMEISENPGEPLLPVLGARIAVPQGAQVTDVKVIPGEERLLAEGVTVRHGQAAYPLSRPELARQRTPRNEAIYGKAGRFPAQSGTAGGVQRARGVAFETIVLHPVAYEPQSGKIFWYETITVEVTTTVEAAGRGRGVMTAGAGESRRARFRNERDRAAVTELVDNPAVVAEYGADPLVVTATQTMALQASALPPVATLDDDPEWNHPVLPCSAADNFQHVVITTTELRSAFQGLVNLRRTQGVNSGMVTLDKIVDSYTGQDTQEAIRNFIRDAYNVWGTEYIVLGGDTEQIPARMLFVSANGGADTDTLPSDLYYQCLDGSFNGNGNALWGEEDDGDGGGDVDLYAEVQIGRVAAATAQEVSYWIAKTTTYDNDCSAGGAGYLRSALFVGEHLGFGGVSEYATGMMEQVRLGSSADGYTTVGFAPFDIYTYTGTLYDTTTAEWLKSDLVTLINANRFAIINHLGHSNTDYNMRLSNSDADALANNKPLFVYSQGCIAGAMDRDCIAEHFTTSTTKGAFGGVWNARYGWGSLNSTDGPSQRYNRHFWDAFFGDGVADVGTANRISHERNAAIISRNCMRWCYYETNLFGDPIQALDGFGSRVGFDRLAYRSDAAAVVSIYLSGSEVMGSSQNVRLSRNADGSGGIDVSCPLSGVEARQTVYRSAAIDLATLGVSHGDTLYAIWAVRDKSATAAIDDIPPQLLNVTVSNPDDGQVRVTWDTDEAARGGINVGLTVPPTDRSAEHANYTTAHSLTVAGLEPLRTFAVGIWAEDYAGNRTWLPADPTETDVEQYYTVSTQDREIRASFDFERDVSGWTTESLTANECWEYGTPTYGPKVASRCWGTKIGGRYPDDAHAMLMSPTVQVGLSPVITFRQWYDIERTPDDYVHIVNADCGYVEVFADGLWHDVSAYMEPSPSRGTVSGTSASWEDARIVLPESFGNKALRIRFRFVSDAVRLGAGNPAGWYIDGVTFRDFPANGVGLIGLGINDMAPGGNENGAAEPGETFELTLCTYNYTTAPIAVREGSFTLQTAGAAAGLVTLTGGAPATVNYGTLLAGSTATSMPYTVSVSALTPAGAVVSVLQTLVDSTGKIYNNSRSFKIINSGPITGRVIDELTEVGIAGATVTATQSDTVFSTVTAADGSFSFLLTSSNNVYRVGVDYGGVHMSRVVVAPTNLTMRLALPLPEFDPDHFDITVQQGNDSTNHTLVIGNGAAASGMLGYSLSVNYVAGGSTGWLQFADTAPLTGSLPAGMALDIDFHTASAALPPGIYTAEFAIHTTAGDFAIPVTLIVEDVLMLAYDSYEVDDEIGGDNDKFPEPGETFDVYVTLANSNPYAAAIGLEATVSLVAPLDGTVTLDSDELAWDVIPAGTTGTSYLPFTMTWDAGMMASVVTLEANGFDFFGRPFNFSFNITNETFHTVTGKVEYVSMLPLTPTNVVKAAASAVVTAVAADGTVLTSQPVDTNGFYTITGARDGVAYWMSVGMPATSRLVPPAGVLHTFYDDEQVDFMAVDYGALDKVPRLRLAQVTIDDSISGDGDGAIDPGETFTVTVTLENDAQVSALAITGLLQNAVFELPDCMSVVNGEAAVPTLIPAGAVAPLEASFTVTASATAQPGDYQRFYFTAATTNDSPILVWPFDFKLVVTPLFSVSGTVTYSDGNDIAKLEATTIAALDGTGRRVATATPDTGSGAYTIGGLQPGNYTIAVTAMPESYYTDPPQPVNLDQDILGIDWLIRPWGVVTDPATIELTLDEGVSTNIAFNLNNNGLDPADVTLDIVYGRTLDEVLPASTLDAAPNLPMAWAQLDTAVFSDSELEVSFSPDSSLAERRVWLTRQGLEAVYWFKRIPAAIARPAGGALLSSLATTPQAMQSDVEAGDVVVHLQPSVKLTHNAMPADPYVESLWGLRNLRQSGGTLGADIGAETAWERTVGSHEVIVAVCDTGVMITHEDLEANIWENAGENGRDAQGNDKATNGIDDDGNGFVDDAHGWNFADNSNDVSDGDGHGTHVAGTIGAVGDNGLGVAGVNWKVRLMPIRLADGGGNFTTSARLAAACEYAMDNGAQVSNHSWGGPVNSQVLYNMMAAGVAANHLFVIAAGNSAENIEDIPAYPASYGRYLPNVITVAAADHDDRLASFSSYGPESVHIAAPGVDILSTVPSETRNSSGATQGAALGVGEGSYTFMSGTSMAAPHVAGAAALLLSLAPDAPFSVIKAALLNGARKDPALEGWVKTGGHLDVARAIRALGHNWLRFDEADATVDGLHIERFLPTPSTTPVGLTVNTPATLPAGEHAARIVIADGDLRRTLPVTVNVLARALPAVDSVAVLDDTNGDGYPEAGESASLRIVLRNDGSSSIDNLSGKIGDTTVNYGYLSGFDVALPDALFPVTFPALPATNAIFTLELFDGTTPLGTLPVNVPLAVVYALAGVVVDADAAPVAGAIVEVSGPYGAATVTAADGTFVIGGLPLAADYECRVIADGFARWSGTIAVPVTGQTIELAAPRVTVSAATIGLTMLQGSTTQVTFTVNNAAAVPYDFTVVAAPVRRVGLFADRDGLGALVAPLQQMGLNVDYFTNNFAVVHEFNPVYNANTIRQYVNYTWDDATLMAYDAVIIDLAGPGGAGRPVYADEVAAYANYLDRGGKLVITGRSPLTRPDNRELADLLGLEETACDIVNEAVGQMTLITDAGAPFIALAAGDSVAVQSGDYARADPESTFGGQPLGVMAQASKIVRTAVGDSGVAYLWTGNLAAGDWAVEGALQDIFRSLLWEELIANAPVSWVALAPLAGTVQESSTTITMALNSDKGLAEGEYAANVVLLGLADSVETIPLRLNLKVEMPRLNAHNMDGKVTDWSGKPLLGNGSDASSLIQILWVGPNGVPDPPQADGSPGGDDLALSLSDSGAPYGYFGSDELPANSGRFTVNVDHPFIVGTPDIVLYARAWDTSSFAAAMAYGDSSVRYTLQYLVGEAANFGSWSLTNIISSLRDTNGDTIPDLWTINFRPDLDPRAPRLPLESMAAATPTNFINTGSQSAPANMVVSAKFLFVLETGLHRIGVYDRATRANIAYYGRKQGNSYTFGPGDGEFNAPLGMAADPRPGQHRFAVSDTGNHRVQVFTYDPDSGAVTFERKFGSQSSIPSAEADGGTFSGPRGITFTTASEGQVVVADTGNFRIQWFKSDGTFKKSIKLTAVDGSSTRPEGVAFDRRNSIDGVWVADSHPEKKRIAFYSLATSNGTSGSPVAGTVYGNGLFVEPTDVKVWTVGERKRLVVTDRSANCVRLLAMDGTPLFKFGDTEDGELVQVLDRPYATAPIDNTAGIYVANQGVNKVNWYNIVLDADGDGMDDFWEDLNGLDSTRDDAFEDPDGDGLSNLGEYRAGTDPQNPDTDGDGGGDLWEMVNGSDPLDPTPTFTPVHLLSLSADPAIVAQGGVTVVTATFDSVPTNTVSVWFYAADGALLGSGVMSQSLGDNTIWETLADTTGWPLGLVDVKLVSLDVDPPICWGYGLFEVQNTAMLVSLSASEAVVMRGSNITVTATFSRDIVPPVNVTLYATNGALVATSAMVAVIGDGSTWRAQFDTTGWPLGLVDAMLVATAVAPPTNWGYLLFEVVDGVTPPPLVWVPYPISGFRRISVTPDIYGIFWRDDAKPQVAPIESYKVEHSPSLLPPNWQEVEVIDRSRPFVGGETLFEVDLDNAPYLNPKNNFFRLFRLE